MSNFICPVCGDALADSGSQCRCGRGHSYDRAKSGYLNLLMSQNRKEKRHGDDRAMVQARTRFLEAGHYRPLLEALARAAGARAPERPAILDLGCGEGYYGSRICKGLAGEGRQVTLLGVDISREAVKACARRGAYTELAVASAFKVPLGDGCCDLVLSVFAPFDPREVRRILRPGGAFVRAYPLEDHLLSLKRLVYGQVYGNRPPERELPGLALEGYEDVRYTLSLDNGGDIQSLFMMTPYFYKTSRSGQERLMAAERLDTEIGFGVEVYGRDG